MAKGFLRSTLLIVCIWFLPLTAVGENRTPSFGVKVEGQGPPMILISSREFCAAGSMRRCVRIRSARSHDGAASAAPQSSGGRWGALWRVGRGIRDVDVLAEDLADEPQMTERVDDCALEHSRDRAGSSRRVSVFSHWISLDSPGGQRL